MFGSRPWLGQVPLILGPSSWGAGAARVVSNPEVGPFWGEWGVVENGAVVNSGKEGPFDTIDEAFRAAAAAAGEHGARKMPLDGFAQVKNANGDPVGPMV